MMDKIVKVTVAVSLFAIAVVMVGNRIQDYRMENMAKQLNATQGAATALVNDLKNLKCDGMADVLGKYVK